MIKIYGSGSLPLELLPKELAQVYATEIASNAAVFRRDDETHITVFLPIFDGWLRSAHPVPTWKTGAYSWIYIKGAWLVRPEMKILDQVNFPNLEN